VVDYVVSLKAAAAATPLPSDPIAAGREVTAKHGCRGCHVLDDGSGGDVGPDLRLSARKLDPTWARAFLHAPQDYPKIYPWRVQAMPRIPLTDPEIDALAAYLAAVGGHPDKPTALPDASAFPAARLEAGKNDFVLRCAQCHSLGKLIETPLAAQQGPDLIRVAGRVDWAWARDWILDPKKIDPKTRMTATDMTPEQVEAVRMFVWKASMDAGAGTQHAAGATR
jgi:mono/diheme cytochrome c family protein